MCTEHLNVTTDWKVVEQYFTVLLFVFFNFTQFTIFINFRLGSVKSEIACEAQTYFRSSLLFLRAKRLTCYTAGGAVKIKETKLKFKAS